MFWSILTSHRLTLLLVLVAGIVTSALLITVSGHSGFRTATTEKSNSSATAVQGKKDQRLEIETVTITPDGFEPQQLERTAGPFILSITNQSGVDALNLRIETEQHARFREKSLPLITPDWRERIDPPPGKYIFTEENHPEWTLTFIIK